MPEPNDREIPSFYETETRLGGRAAYDTAKAAGRTNLDYRQWVQVRTPEFKAWFGDWENGAVPRRLLDDNDEPKVFFPERIPDHLTVTRNVVRTEQQKLRIRETVIRYVKYDAQGYLIADCSSPKDGLTPETVTRTRTGFVSVERNEAVTEKLRFSVVAKYPLVVDVCTDKNKPVGYLSLWHERKGESLFLSDSRPISKRNGGSFWVPYKAELDKDYQGLGIAAALYRFAEQETGEQIYPSRVQSEAAQVFWDKRRRHGGFSGYFMNEAGQMKSATDNTGRFSPDNPYTDDSPYRPPEISQAASSLERNMPENPTTDIHPEQKPPETARAASASAQQQNPQGGLNMAKHHYLMQGTMLTAAEKQQRAVLEHAMEQTIKDLPPDVQNQARTNFYLSQVREAALRHSAAAEAGQQNEAAAEISVGR